MYQVGRQQPQHRQPAAWDTAAAIVAARLLMLSAAAAGRPPGTAWLQMFNMINARKVEDEYNVFEGGCLLGCLCVGGGLGKSQGKQKARHQARQRAS